MMRIKKEILCLTAIFICSAILLSGAFTAQAEEKGSVKRYMCKDLNGNKRWEAVMTISPMKEKGMYLIAEEGSGTYFGFDGKVSWKAETEFLDDGTRMTPLRMKKTYMSEDGKAIFEGTQEFDSENNKVTCCKKWLNTGKEVRKTLKYKGDIVNEFLLGSYTERFLKNGEREKSFYLVTNDPSIYKISAEVKAEEDITVNGMNVKAYNIRLDPEVGLLGMFAPETRVWHLAGGGFNWLKYKGAEDTIDSPVVEMETLDKF